MHTIGHSNTRWYIYAKTKQRAMHSTIQDIYSPACYEDLIWSWLQESMDISNISPTRYLSFVASSLVRPLRRCTIQLHPTGKRTWHHMASAVVGRVKKEEKNTQFTCIDERVSLSYRTMIFLLKTNWQRQCNFKIVKWILRLFWSTSIDRL